MFRRLPAIVFSLALLALLPASAEAKHAPAIPVVKSISPLSVGIGETLTITGKNFVKGTGKNIVVFKRDKGRAVFVKAGKSTTTQLTVVVPEKLRTFLPVTKGAVGNAHFRVRVLAKRLSKSFTAFKASPLVGPYPGGKVSAPPPPDCDGDGQIDDSDSDNDGLPDAIEVQIKTDRCKADTDGDGVTDGFEYESALDLNVRAVPYPGKKPYPNPLDATDAKIDFDGDSLTLTEEFQLWNAFGVKGWPLELNYSDGSQATGATVAAPGDATNPQLRFLDTNHNGVVDQTELGPLDTNGSGVIEPDEYAYNDLNGDGVLTDDERDADMDGLSNYDETHGRMTVDLWNAIYTTEVPYPINYAQPVAWETDTDGDGIPDGLDDQDFDGFTNLQELSRFNDIDWLHGQTPGTKPDARVNPYNPCLPRNAAYNPPNARDCMLHPPTEGAPAPYDGSDHVNYQVSW
jgi:hypothetical protein